ncbi:MAG: hypothetical protein QGI09_02780, partial [Dehalococcoidia bacterium]|nr:hypothetical protein [Dehalococcoidia bacterium]
PTGLGLIVAALALLPGSLSPGWAQEPPPPQPPPSSQEADPQIQAFLRSWAEAMSEIRTLRVEFTQEKELPILRRPIRSRCGRCS